MTKSRSNHIDVAKGVAIILVVYGHAAAQLQGYPVYNEYLDASNRIIFSFVMPVFFMVSGAFQRIRLESDKFNEKIYLTKITKSILLPYYSLSLLFMAINIVFSNVLNAPSIKEMLCALSIQQSNSDWLPSGVLWFLFTLYIFHVVTFIYIKKLNANILYLVVVALILRSDINIFHQYHYLAFDKVSHFLLFYLFGFIFDKNITEAPPKNPVILSALLVAYLVLTYIQHLSKSNELANILFIAMSMIGAAGIALSLLTIGISHIISSKYNASIVVKVLAYYGMFSILVYVFHMPTIAIFKKIALLLKVNSDYLYQLLLFIPGIILPFIYGKILSYNRFIYKTLLGREPV
ncbi:MAG TPA: acyltransferase [Dissulfurispiraceae bacterium]|nr:acyltransferase [Dissulfurispiraceae bacterium]